MPSIYFSTEKFMIHDVSLKCKKKEINSQQSNIAINLNFIFSLKRILNVHNFLISP